jgi:arginine:ornithine antiporter / lysine permease
MASADTSTDTSAAHKLTLITMTGMVVGSMVGAGVFSLPRRFAQETGVAGALIAWVVAGTGMLMLAFVFQTLAVRKPNLDAGVYAYAKAGFGEYLGFFSAFGYWASACVGNVTYWVLIMSTVGAIAPALGHGDTLLAIALSTVGVWVYFYFIQRGVQGGGHQPHRHDRQGRTNPRLYLPGAVRAGPAGLRRQPPRRHRLRVLVHPGQGHDAGHRVRVPGGRGRQRLLPARQAARRRRPGDDPRVLSVFAVFASVTIVSYGVLPAGEIAELRQPSMAGVLESVVGEWGKAFVSVGLIVSVLGAYLAWTLMAAEVLFVAAKDDDMPRFLGRTRGADVPFPALLLSTILVQVMLVVTLFSEDAFNFALDLTSALTLIPFLLAAAYALKLALTRETYTEQPEGRSRELVVGALATIYTAFLLFAAGPKFILVSFIIYAPATILFVMARREQGRQLFSPAELAILAVSVVGAIAGVVALATGWISI